MTSSLASKILSMVGGGCPEFWVSHLSHSPLEMLPDDQASNTASAEGVLLTAFTWRRCFCYESERAYANARRFPPGWLAYVASLGELAKPWFQTTYGWRMKHTMVQLWMRFSGTFRYPPGSTYIDAHRRTCALKGALGPWIPGSIRKANELIHRSPAPNGLWSPTPPHCLVGQNLQSEAPGRVP